MVYGKVNPALAELGVTRMSFWRRVRAIVKRKRFFRKDKNGIYPYEKWDFRLSLAYILYPRFKSFKENYIGIPPYLPDKNGEQIYFDDFENFEDAVAAWEGVLQTIENSFRLVIQERVRNDFLTEEEIKQIEEGLRLFAEYYLELWT